MDPVLFLLPSTAPSSSSGLLAESLLLDTASLFKGLSCGSGGPCEAEALLLSSLETFLSLALKSTGGIACSAAATSLAANAEDVFFSWALKSVTAGSLGASALRDASAGFLTFRRLALKSISWLLDSSTRIRSGLGVVWAAGGGGVGAVEGCLDLKDSNSSETSWWAGAAPDGEGEVVFCAALEEGLGETLCALGGLGGSLAADSSCCCTG